MTPNKRNQKARKQKIRERRVKAWAIWHKHKDIIMEVAFEDCADFVPKKEMFVNENGVPAWQGKQYKLISCTITYELPQTLRGKKR